MLTKLIVKNFKKLDQAEVELGNPVVFIGPNNSGKTSALQALALWEIGLRRWNEKRKGKTAPEKRPGVTINRRDLVAIPVPGANLLWRDLNVRDVSKIDGKQETKNVFIEITVEGITEDKTWQCGLEFYYANEESFYCRPLRVTEGQDVSVMKIPDLVSEVRIAFLPPMSGLAANETRLDEGAINVRVGEGRTAEVLRNLCYKICTEDKEGWKRMTEQIESLFGSKLGSPQYISERGEISLNYKEHDIIFDLSSSGRGLQQTLLLLSYMYANKGAVLLLDEPDAHLEILRQRQIYQLLVDVAKENGNQVIAASHSEVMLNEAAERDVVIAFVGKPHRINDRGAQVIKSLKEIGFEHYYQAEQTGWVLYLEGSTDLAILRAFAQMLNNKEAGKILERPFVHYVANQVSEIKKHFHGLREACPGLHGLAIFDRLEPDTPVDIGIPILQWRRREIENYLCTKETLLNYAEASAMKDAAGPLFSPAESKRRIKAMEDAISEVEKSMETLDKGSPWDINTKVSDDFLTPLFKLYFKKIGLYNLMAKKNFYDLAQYVPVDKLDPEINEKLDAIVNAFIKERPVNQ
jgi:ABC-type taurine transport system ATPase subunit